MIKVSCEEPLGYGSTISFNINGRKFTGVLDGLPDKTYIFPRGTLISSIEADLKCSLKEFFSKTLGTQVLKYKGQYWPEEPLENLKIVLKALEGHTDKKVEFEKPLKDNSRIKFITPGRTYHSYVNYTSYTGAFIWIEDDSISPDRLVRKLCGKGIKEVYFEAGAEIISSGQWPFSTLKDLEKVLDYINEHDYLGTQKPVNNPIKQQQNGNEIKLQRTKGVIRKGTVPEGSRICSKINAATISIQPIENTAISG